MKLSNPRGPHDIEPLDATGDGAIGLLVEAGLLHKRSIEVLHPWQYQREALAERLAGRGRVHEVHATKLLACLDGELEQAVVRAFCALTGTEHRESLKIISGSQFNSDKRVQSRRSIDLVIIDTVDAEGVPYANENMPAIIAIEAKLGGSVNGDLNYCPSRSGEYSDQTICYLHGCTFPKLDRASTKFVWMTLDGSGFGRGRLHDREKHELYRAAYEVHRELSSNWTHCSWRVVYEAVSAHIGNSPAASAILAGLRAP